MTRQKKVKVDKKTIKYIRTLAKAKANGNKIKHQSHGKEVFEPKLNKQKQQTTKEKMIN